AQAGSSRPTRQGPSDSPNVKVGRDLNVNVNVNVVPASATMPNGGGADGCACTCPALGGVGGLAGALAGNLLGGFLPGTMRQATGSGSDGGGISMQQSAPQHSDVNPARVGVRAATAAMAATAGALLGARSGSGTSNHTSQVNARPLRRWRPLANGGTSSGIHSGDQNNKNSTANSIRAGFRATGTLKESADKSGTANSSSIGTSLSGNDIITSNHHNSTDVTSMRGSGSGSGVRTAFTAVGARRRRRHLSATAASSSAVGTDASSGTGSDAPIGPMGRASTVQPASETSLGPITAVSVAVVPRRQLKNASITDVSAWLNADSGYGTSGDLGKSDTNSAHAAGWPVSPTGLRSSTGSGLGDVYSTEYGPPRRVETNPTSSDQILDLIQALIDQVTSSDVAVKIGVDGSDGPVTADSLDSADMRQAMPYVPIVASAGGSDGTTATSSQNQKPTNNNVNPIVLPSLQRSGPEITRGASGRPSGCPPCRC
ncbi:hypothetical protein Vretimale_17191, partial [Volvox reticuliferus]